MRLSLEAGSGRAWQLLAGWEAADSCHHGMGPVGRQLLGDKLEGALRRGQTGQPPSFLTLPLGLSRVAGSSEDG